jgi:hypothetical protein
VIHLQVPLQIPCDDLTYLVVKRFFPERASSPHNSVGLTGGVCKRQGLIHRTMLKSDYYEFQRHVDELQSTIWTEIDFRD